MFFHELELPNSLPNTIQLYSNILKKFSVKFLNLMFTELLSFSEQSQFDVIVPRGPQNLLLPEFKQKYKSWCSYFKSCKLLEFTFYTAGKVLNSRHSYFSLSSSFFFKKRKKKGLEM